MYRANHRECRPAVPRVVLYGGANSFKFSKLFYRTERFRSIVECLLNCKRRTPCGGESKSNRLQVCILNKKKLEQQYIVAEKSNFKHSFLFYLSFLPIIAPTCPTVQILSYNSWGMLCS